MTEPLPRSRGTVFLQVLVAAIFLAVIGGSVGLAAGLYDRNRDGVQRGAINDGTRQNDGGTSQDGSGPTQSGGGGTSTPCPSDSNLEAHFDQDGLAKVLYVKTDNSEVWICGTAGGTLYYGGHRFSDDSRIFLTDVQKQDGEYVATNTSDQGTTVYRVSRQKLVIENAGGTPEEQRVINSDG